MVCEYCDSVVGHGDGVRMCRSANGDDKAVADRCLGDDCADRCPNGDTYAVPDGYT